MKASLRLKHILKESGLAVDSPALLDWLLERPRLRRFCARFLRLRFTPLILDRIRGMDTAPDKRSCLFSQAISLINAGETYKTTARDRTRQVDRAILRHASRLGARSLLEVGASDGMASLHLMDSLPGLERFVLSDRHPVFRRLGCGPVRLVLDGDSRLLGIKLLFFYVNLSLNRRVFSNRAKAITTINPYLLEHGKADGIVKLDMRIDRTEPPVHIIKCANVFNCQYFPEAIIKDAVHNLGRSLLPGGLLFISQNNDRYADGEAYFVLEKTDIGMRFVEEQNKHEAVHLFSGQADS